MPDCERGGSTVYLSGRKPGAKARGRVIEEAPQFLGKAILPCTDKAHGRRLRLEIRKQRPDVEARASLRGPPWVRERTRFNRRINHDLRSGQKFELRG
jgi:ribosomal protein S30